MSQQQPPRSSRGNPAMGDIVRSVVVIGVVILLLWGIGQFFTRTPDSPVREIDYEQVVGQARDAAEFPLVAPERLPGGWKANTARYEGDSWHLGVLTDDEDYIGLEQVPAEVPAAVDRFAEGSKAAGKVEVAGETWSVRTGPQGRVTYVRREGDLTTLVNSTASRRVVEDYISSLV